MKILAIKICHAKQHAFFIMRRNIKQNYSASLNLIKNKIISYPPCRKKILTAFFSSFNPKEVAVYADFLTILLFFVFGYAKMEVIIISEN